MTVTEEIETLLKEHGAVLDRQHKHPVWRLPDGRIFVAASTPGDVRWERNSLADLRRLLGVKRVVHKNPARREKKGVARPGFVNSSVPARPGWREKLAAAVTRRELDFVPSPCCCPVDVRVAPMTPVWCILRCLLGYGGKQFRASAE